MPCVFCEVVKEGEMINVFDLSISMAGTKVLVDKPHQDGSPIRRVVSEIVKKAPDPVGGSTEGKSVTPEVRCVSKCMGTPVKMLIEQEMLKEFGMQRKPTTVVAKLMGLETCPSERFDRIPGRMMVGNKTQRTIYGASEAGNDGHHIKETYHDRIIRSAGYSFSARLDGSRECRDVNEIPLTNSGFRNGRQLDSNVSGAVAGEKGMALVRQNYVEAKRMAMDEKLVQSKEFLDALDVLNSNKELFLKLIEEPTSLVSKQNSGLEESPSLKRITVLKPSKQQDVEVEEETSPCLPWQEQSPLSDSYVRHPKSDDVSHPTRIVVLRPNPSQTEDTKNLAASPTLSGRHPKEEDFVKVSETLGGLINLNEKLQDDFDCMKDEISSVPSNGYNGDESSVNISEGDYMDDEFHSFSDSDSATEHHINRCESPYYASCFGPPYSPDSAIIFEAKRRLSQRWAKVSSYKPTRERKVIQKSASTLGEMLFEAKRNDARDEVSLAQDKLQVAGQDMQALSTFLASSNDGNNFMDKYKGLPRSKSAPFLPTVYGNAESNCSAENSAAASEKIKRSKSLFKVKVSSIFSLKNKKSDQERSSTPQLLRSDSYQDASSCTSNEASSYISKDLSSGIPICSSDQAVQILETLSQTSLPLEKYGAMENAIESPGQPSPVSVLESPFVDDVNCNSSQPCESASMDSHRGISRSPPIESVARKLIWNDSYLGNQFSHHRRHSSGFLEVKAEEHERVMFIQDLLTAAGLDGETDCSVLTKWHPVDSPLSPLLLNRFIGCKREDSKSRQIRAQRRLLFDLVSVILLELCLSCTKDRSPSCTAFSRGGGGGSPNADSSVTEAVLGRIQGLFSCEESWPCELSCSQVVDGMVRHEVVESVQWLEMGETEVGQLGREFETQLMEELVDEALDDFISGWS